MILLTISSTAVGSSISHPLLVLLVLLVLLLLLLVLVLVLVLENPSALLALPPLLLLR
jgi:hypothetical protein